MLFVGILGHSDRVCCSSCCGLILLLRENTSPFIDEGDGLTSERESVRMLSLVAHAVGYKMIVGAHNTVNIRCMLEVASSSSGMADVGACHTVDAQSHARGFTVLVRYGSFASAHNTVGQMSTPTILLRF